jgi:hypothetical protein
MTAFMRAFLSCNSCGNFLRDETIPQDETVAGARREAKRQGWTKKVVDGVLLDFCEDCTYGRSRGPS